MTDELPDPTILEPDEAAFVVDDDSKAAWAARKARAAQEEADRIETVYADELERLKAEGEAAARPWQHRVEFFTGLLEGYHLRLIEEKGDSLPDSYKVPGAVLKRRKQPDSIVFEDPEEEGEFTSWALMAGLYDMVKVTAKKQEIKAWVGDAWVTPDLVLDEKGKPLPGQASRVVDTDTGEPIPGVKFVVGEKKPSVQITRGDQ